MMILLGWEIGTGRRVEIPDTGHLAWFGQTQLSGKTTALEAIAFRGELKAVAFITKQGEGGFLTGRMIPPYFSEPTNDEEQPLWRWVKSILEAGQQRRMNFEESWIIRACEDPRQAKTLKDVHENIKLLLAGEKAYGYGKLGRKSKVTWIRKPVTGINAGVYTSLKAYFDIVMPQLARLPYTKKLVLGPGLNVMDLREYAMETQALVIRSVMEWVYQHEKGVRVIVPEAQDFVPQGKNSPVKMACETLVRKAGANKNFMWLDSQDMAAVDKIMLRACSIVGIGVQTEGHEIERSLAGLFTPALRPVDIARLKIGEFFVRTPEARVQKCYVQPAWMESELHAQAIAKGEESVSSARQMLKAFKKKLPPPPQLLQLQIQEPPDVEEEESPDREQGHIGVDRYGRQDVSDLRDTADDRGRGCTLETADAGLRDGILADRSLRSAPGSRGRAAHDGTDEQFNSSSSQERETDERSEKDPSSPQSQTEDPSRRLTPSLRVKEPGKHEETTNPGICGPAGTLERTENASETVALDETVPGAPVSFGGSENHRESERAMPQTKQTPFEIVKQYFVDFPEPAVNPHGLGSTIFLIALRDLLKDHAALIEAHDVLATQVKNLTSGYEKNLERSANALTEAVEKQNGHGLRFTVPDLDYIWKYVKAKAEKDSPAILEVLTRRPELRIKIERQTIQMDDSQLIGRIARLLHEGWFAQPKNGPAVQKELKRRGCEQPTTNLYKPLNKLTEMGFLTLESDGYREVAEMKALVQKA